MTAAGAPTLTIDRDRLAPGHAIGAYRIVEPLGDGGMGVVYVAEHSLIGRRVAIKILRAEYGANPQVVERFFNEARVTTAVRHPAIVEVFDFGCTPEHQPYIVMELLAGQSLAARLAERGKLATIDALAITRGVASALAAAHGIGVIHRDLKPDNVFLVRDPDGDRVKLLDFGIAKLETSSLAARTRTGLLLGTPQYMSPEQVRGAGAVDHRSDIYSLGCVLFEMLAGHAPFNGDLAELLTGHVHRPPPPLVAPPGIAALVEAMLAKDPARRPMSSSQLVAQLDKLIELEHAQPSVVHAASTGPWVIGSPAIPSVAQVARARRWRAPIVAAACIAAGLAAWGWHRHVASAAAEAPSVELDGIDDMDVAVRGTTNEILEPGPTATAFAPNATSNAAPSGALLGTSSKSIVAPATGAKPAVQPEVSTDLVQPPTVGVDTPVP